MKKWMRRAMAMMVAMMLAAGAVAVAEKETPSEGYRLPTIKVRPTEAPDTEQQPVAPTQAPEEEKPVLGKMIVTLENEGSTLNIRGGAGKDTAKVGSLANGEEVYILGASGEWTNIRTMDGVEGYVMTRYLQEEPAVEPTEEPVVEPTEEPVVEPTEEPTVEPTEEPAVEPTEEVVLPTEEPLEPVGPIEEETDETEVNSGTQVAEIIDAEYANRVVRIYASWDQSKEYLDVGDEMTFTAVLEGYDGLSYQIQWQTSVNGSDWTDLSDANGLNYTLVLSEQNYDDFFRAVVNVTGLQG